MTSSSESPSSSVSLGSLTSPDVAAAAADEHTNRRILLVPLGSTEQHGPHLPLDTDTRVAVAVAEAVAARHPGEVAVAPALAYGASGEHRGFAGTLSIGQAALELVIVELVRSLGPELGHVVLVNGHGGNVEALARALATLRHEQRPVDLWSPHLEGGDTHAGLVETSLLLAIDPSVVRLDRAEPGVTTPLAELLPALRAGGLAAVTTNGILGDPTGASAARGRELLTMFVDDLDVVVSRVVLGTVVAPDRADGADGSTEVPDEDRPSGVATVVPVGSS